MTSFGNQSQRIRNQIVSLIAVTIGCCAFLAKNANAQSVWEVTPYRIHCWVESTAKAALPGSWSNELAQDLTELADSRVASVWTFSASSTPAAVRGDVVTMSDLTLDQVFAASPDLKEKEFDKLMLVVVDRDLDGYRVLVREFDLSTLSMSAPISQDRLPLARQIAPSALKLMCDVFTPVVRIERIEEDVISAVARAGSMERPKSSVRHWNPPTQIPTGRVLQPVIRKSDRSGKVTAEGIKPVEWTVMTVQEAVKGKLTCSFRSGYRQPFRIRRSSRIQQLAYVVKPRYDSTILRVVDRRKPENPLAGYEVLSKPDEDGPSVSIGRTDWQGEIVIDRDLENPIQTLFVRSGQQLLGKLPMVAGQLPEVVAPLRNDEVRLEAEGFLIGVQDGLVDLVARREVLASRIRSAIADDKIDLAEELLKELRGLDTNEDFAARVQQRKRSLTTADQSVQERIDDLFSQTRTLLQQYLDPKQVEVLAQAIRDAKAGDGAGS